MVELSPGTDWYDWLDQHTEIRAGKVRVLQAHAAERCSVKSCPETSFDEVLADLREQDKTRLMCHAASRSIENCQAATARSPMLERTWGSGEEFECIEEECAPGAAVSCGDVLSDDRAEHSPAHMAPTELQKFEERIVQRVLVETVKNMQLGEERVGQQICDRRADAKCALEDERIRDAFRNLWSSTRDTQYRLSQLTASLRDELENTRTMHEV